AIPAVQFNTEGFEPGSRAGAEAEGHQHGVGRQDFFGTRNHFRTATAIFVRLTHLSGHHFHAFDFAVADNFDRLTVKQELYTFLTGIHHFALGARHIGFVAAVSTGHTVGA